MSARFGTDGIRGVAGETPITVEVAARVGRATSRLATGGRVLVAWDPRPSSEALAHAVAQGAAAAGSDVGMLGAAPTSALGVALARGLGECGVMVTASHNRWTENGFKVLGAGGAKPDDALAARLEAWIADEPAIGVRPGEIADARRRGLGAWESAMDDALDDPSPIAHRRLAVDLANGAAIAVIPWLQQSRAEWFFVGDGGLPNDGVGSEHPEALGRRIRELGCDGGFAVDGDADRCVVLDARGEAVPGDALAWLLARDRGATGIAVTLMSNGCLERQLPGVRVVRTPVGDRFVREAMLREQLPLGAEESGHVLFDDFPAGDGVLTGLRALSAAFRSAPSIAAAVAEFQPLPRRLSKVRVARRPPLEDVEPLARAAREGKEALGEEGRVYLRYSGTEPLLRVLVEGRDAAVVASVADGLARIAAEVLA